MLSARVILNERASNKFQGAGFNSDGMADLGAEILQQYACLHGQLTVHAVMSGLPAFSIK